MLKNYFTKISLDYKFSRNLKTFFKLILNSKRYSYVEKNNLRKNNIAITDSYNFIKNGKKFDVLMRTYSGDISIFYEIFWKKVYDIPKKILKSPPKVFIDLGAHVGFASIYFAFNYPDSEIYAVEASKNNFKILRENIKAFEQIQALNYAIYPFDGEVIFDDGGLSYNSKLGTQGITVPSISIPTLMKKYNLKNIHLLKIDIEGAEKELLGKNNDWLKDVDNIVIELHKPYNINDLRRDLEPFGFSISQPAPNNGLLNIFARKLNTQLK